MAPILRDRALTLTFKRDYGDLTCYSRLIKAITKYLHNDTVFAFNFEYGPEGNKHFHGFIHLDDKTDYPYRKFIAHWKEKNGFVRVDKVKKDLIKFIVSTSVYMKKDWFLQYENLHKLYPRIFDEWEDVRIVPNNYSKIFKRIHGNKVIKTENDIMQWFSYHNTQAHNKCQ